MDDSRRRYDGDDSKLRRMQTDTFSTQRPRQDRQRFWDTVLQNGSQYQHHNPHTNFHYDHSPHTHKHTHPYGSHQPHHSSAMSPSGAAGMSSQHRRIDSASLRHYQSHSFHAPSQHNNLNMNHGQGTTRRKDFQCELCSSSFSQKSHLTQHIKTVHQKIKPYKCEYCGRAFGKRYDLTSHIDAVHRKERPHTCNICGKTFAKRSNLTRHIQQMHANR